MTDFKAIKGFNVKSLATDPLGAGAPNGVWSSGGALNTAGSNNSGLGSQDAAIVVGRSGPAADLVELYNGTSWSEIAEINTGRLYTASAGTSTAGITFGGNARGNETEKYQGGPAVVTLT